MRKILSLAMILMLVVCLATTAFAAEPTYDISYPMELGMIYNLELAAGEETTINFNNGMIFDGSVIKITGADSEVTVNGNPVATVGDVAEVTLAFQAMTCPVTLKNVGASAVTYTIEKVEPLGSWSNPAEVTALDTPIEVNATAMGYYLKYTATVAGVLKVTATGDNWSITINNNTTGAYGDEASSNNGDTFAANGMSVGDEMEIVVGTADWTDATFNITLSVVDHITEAVAAGEAECHTPSNIAHYYCKYCDKYFADEAATTELTESDVFGAALGATNVTHVPEVPAKCHEDGTAEHWICGGCNGYFADEDCTIETNMWSIGLSATGAVDVEHIPAVPAGCHNIGNIEHWICGGCGAYFEDEFCSWEINPELVTIAATGAENITHVEKLDPECHNHGMQEHWICDDCGGYFSDAECTQQVMQPRHLYIPAEVELEHYAEVPAECHSNGNIEHWFCPECEGFYLDAEGIRVTNSLSVILPATGITTVTHYEAQEAYCHRNGMQEHWICDDCGGYFTDAECTEPVQQPRYLVIPAEKTLKYTAEVPATCVEDGMKEHWYCAECDCYFTDAEGIYNIARLSLVLPADGTAHDLEHHEAADPACHKNGNMEYWYCGECDCYFINVEGNLVNSNAKNVVILAEETLEHHEKVEAGCHINGMQEYWYCAECDCYFTDAEGKYNIARLSLVIPAETKLEHHEKVGATCEENGMQEYWYCAECDCYFTDAEGKYNIARLSLVIPAPGHTYLNGVCTECGNDNPNTGDLVILPILGLLMSTGATVAMLKKKEF